MARMRRRFADRSEAAIANADRFGRERIGFTGDASQMGRDLTSGIMNPNLRRADIGPVGRSPLTRNEIAENRWNAFPAGVYDMSGNAKTWFPQIDEEVRGFAYDSGLTPAGGPILTQDEIAENRWNAIPEGNIYDMSPGQDYFGPRNEEYEDFPPWFAGGGAVGLEPGIASLMGYAKGGMVTRVKVPKGQSKWMKKFMNNMRDS